MLNETFNNIPVEQETADKDTIIYIAGSNGKPLQASIEKKNWSKSNNKEISSTR